ncbi:unnamed protein product [Rotaria sordida]|uniref:Uncharacterized protein n=1 Tax=Rotaria sordida TaxID=392033 RepID=A0A815TGB7_9BILA|nr:unnamed protein product [Rotaria sordida]
MASTERINHYTDYSLALLKMFQTLRSTFDHQSQNLLCPKTKFLSKYISFSTYLFYYEFKLNLLICNIYLIQTHVRHSGLDIWPRLRRFIAISSFRASRFSSERIKDFFIPTRKHFAKRQQLHERRYLYVIIQSPSF